MSSGNSSNWISLSDMMTGLMLVFLLISVLTISHVIKQEEKRKELLVEFDVAKTEIYNDLVNAFQKEEDNWGIKIDNDLSIKFENPDVLFGYLSDDITPEFRIILDEFVPRYIEIINNPKYRDKIKEVRIEGHTASWDDYNYTIELSQKRSNAVLRYILSSQYYAGLTEEEKERLKFWFTSNGLGNGRMIDADGDYIFYSRKESEISSRRVEFRIVTTSEELIDRIINDSIR